MVSHKYHLISASLSAAGEIEAGLVEANLGGNVFKKRLARAGEGKSGGYRTIVFFKSGERTFFHYAYPKSERDNITTRELHAFKRAAKSFFKLKDEELDILVKIGDYTENGGAKNPSSNVHRNQARFHAYRSR